MYKKAKAEALKLYLNARGKITYSEIARAVFVNPSTISAWKKKYNWEEELNNILSQKEPEATEEKMKESLSKAKEEADKKFNLIFNKKDSQKYNVSSTEISTEDPSGNLVDIHGAALNEREKVFLKYYLLTFNAASAAKLAYPEMESSNVFGRAVLQRVEVQKCLKICKDQMSKDLGVRAYDVIERFMKVAFADLFDFITIHYDDNGKQHVKLKHNIDMMDTTAIKKIYRNRNGIVVELEDRHKALDQLSQFFDAMPDVWRREMEEAYLRLKEREVDHKIELQEMSENQFKGQIFMPMMAVLDRPEDEIEAGKPVDLTDVLSRDVE